MVNDIMHAWLVLIICVYSLVPGVSFDLFDSLYKPDAPTVHVSDR